MKHLRNAALLSLSLACNVQAMQPCKEAAGCVDDVSASMLAWVEAIADACSRENPSEAQRYEAGLAREVQQESPAFIHAVKAHPAYPEAKQEALASIQQMSKATLARECSDFLPQAPQ